MLISIIMKQIRKSVIPVVVIFSIIISLSSCVKNDFDFEKLSTEIKLNPSFALPLAYGNLVLRDIIEPDDTLLVFEQDGEYEILKIIFSEDSLFSFKVGEVIEIPDQTQISINFKLGEITIDDFSENRSLSLQELINNLDPTTKSAIELADGLGGLVTFPAIPLQNGGEYNIDPLPNFGSVSFSDGILTVTLTNELPVAIDNITLRVKDNISFDKQLSFTNIAPDASSQGTINLKNETMSNELTSELVKISSSESPAPVLIDLDNDRLVISVSATNVKVKGGTAIIPDQNFSLDQTDVTFEVEGDEEITSLHLSSGQIDYSITSVIGEDILLKIILPATTINDVVFKDSVLIAKNTTISGSFDLANSITDLTKEGDTCNTIPVEYEVDLMSSGELIPFSSTDSLSFDFTINDIDFSYIEGYLGQQNIEVESGEIDLNIDFFNNISGGFTLSDPNLNILYTNSIGIPISFILDIVGESGDGEIQGLNAGERNILSPANISEGSVSDTIKFNNTNSDIVEFIALPPSKITYSGTATTNPSGKTGINNFVTDQSAISVGIEMELPIELMVDSLTLQDTVDFEVNIENMQIEGSATLNIYVENGFPFDVSFTIILYDSITSLNLDTISADLLSSASVNVQGRVYQTTSSNTEIVIDDELLDNLNNANKLIVIGSISTYNNGTVPVKIYTDYSLYFSVKIAGEFTINVSPDDDGGD